MNRTMMKFCANLSFMFQEESVLLKRYSLASNCGFKAVECAFPYEHKIEDLVKAKESCGLKQILINTPIDNGDGKFGLAGVVGKESKFMEGIELAVKYAKALDCNMVHVMAGTVVERNNTNYETYRKNIQQAAALLNQHNIVTLIEPINGISVPNYFLNDYHEALSVISQSDNVKLMLDVFHLQQICGNLTVNVNKFKPFIGHVQIAQVPSRNEPDSPGEINYKYFFDVLKSISYDGWIGLEYKPAQSTKDGLKWIESMGFSL